MIYPLLCAAVFLLCAIYSTIMGDGWAAFATALMAFGSTALFLLDRLSGSMYGGNYE